MDQRSYKTESLSKQGTKIPICSTPIKNVILTDIFAKGLLKYNEMRIVAYVIRCSWGFVGKNRRQDWTKPLTHQKVADAIGMARQTVTTNINSMVKQ